ncbi:MAG TPA: response regulator [Bryobacteraceae bacterium]|jgi:CheY-like chemotaxis protein|nr:response regulator [Bryobacteraceae bacterium]
MPRPIVVSVEDDDGGYVVLRELLREMHPEVRLERARDGSEALAKLKSLSTDATVQVRLVLLDLRLPGMSGIEVLTAIRADESLRQIPVVVLTGKAREADRVLCLENGAQEYVEKPWDLQGLEKVIKEVCTTAGL